MISNQNISKIGKLIVASYTKIIWRLTEGNILLHLMKRGYISIIAMVKGESAMLKEAKWQMKVSLNIALKAGRKVS